LNLNKTMSAQTISISLPDDMAREINAVATRERRTVSEVMREAWRAYRTDQLARLAARTAQYAAGQNPLNHTEADIPRLVKEVRKAKRQRATHN
jgi:Arc/MetJ-type ribon-helix-helix transcriptional regulator